MRESPRWFGKQGTVVLTVLVAAACATQIQEEDEFDVVPGTPIGSGGDTGGTPPLGTGGSLDAMMGTGGTMPMGGVMSMGGGGSGKGGSGAGTMSKGGTGAGGNSGSGTGGANAMGGSGGSSAGMITMPGAGKGGATTGSGGKGGSNAMGGAGMASGGNAGGGTGGRGSGGMTTGSGGRSSTGGASAGGSAGSGSSAACPNPRDPAEPGATQGNSGGFMTKAAVCYFVEGSFNAWDCSNLADRMVTVNGKASDCGDALPAKVDGGYYFSFTASATTDYTSFFWFTQ